MAGNATIHPFDSANCATQDRLPDPDLFPEEANKLYWDDSHIRYTSSPDGKSYRLEVRAITSIKDDLLTGTPEGIKPDVFPD